MNHTETQQVLDALKLLDPELIFENWENGDGEEIHEQLRAVSAICEASLARVVEPVYQYQLANGNWIDQTKESYDYNVKHGNANVRALFATPQEAAAQPSQAVEWIPVGERMPEPQVRVMAFDAAHNIVEVDMWFGPDFNWGYSHWMPLPQEPKP